MAITASNLTAGGSLTDSQTYDTASVTPGANRLVLVSVGIRNYGAANLGTISLSGNGLTYVEVATITYSSIAAPLSRLSIFRGMGASPSAGAITITVSGTGQNSCAWSVDEFAGTDTSGTNGSGAIVQSANCQTDDADPAPSITLAALGDAVNNAVYACFGNANNRALTPTTDYTELTDQAPGNNCAVETHYKVPGTTSLSATGYSNFDDAAGIAVEIKAAVAGGLAANALRGGGAACNPLWGYL